MTNSIIAANETKFVSISTFCTDIRTRPCTASEHTIL